MIKMSNLAAKAAKKSPTLFVIVGVGFMVGAVAKACTSTKRYLDEINTVDEETGEVVELETKEKIKIAAKCYWETAALTTLAAMSFVTSNRINLRRNAALMTMYGISEAKRLEYMQKTKEILGEKKESEIREKIAEQKVNNKLPSNEMLEQIPVGDTLCYDTMFGRYFFSSSEKIMAAEKRLNDKLFGEMYISLNDFFYELGLEKVSFGDEFGWNVNDGLINIRRIYTENKQGVPCIVLDYDVTPRHDFANLH